VSIRFKVILPYLILTLLVAVTGVYVVTRLVANSLSERLTNQLLEAGRVVSDGIARQEIRHVEVGRVVAYTRGVAEAVEAGNAASIARLVRPLAAGLDAENLIVIDRQGAGLLHTIRRPDGTLRDVSAAIHADEWSFVQPLLGNPDSQTPPTRGLALNGADGRYYYYTAVPVAQNAQIVGVVLVGTSLETTLPYLKSMSLADVVIYQSDGQAIATTMGAQSLDAQLLESLSISGTDYDRLLVSAETTQGESFSVEGRWYSLARGSLRVSSDRVGVYAVVLPMDFVIQPGSASRNTYVGIFTLAMIAVVVIGYVISRLIINPLSSLVRTSQAIAQGDLNQRSGIRSADEIGTLASTFDEMTSRLQQRTDELERAYHTLEQMDRTKSTFIDVSAHELRSPLTLVKGYAQMLETKTRGDAEVQGLSKGLLEGVERMTDVVNNMLDVTKIDSNVLKLVQDPVQVGSVVSRVEKLFEKDLEERKLTFNAENLDQLPVIDLDPDLIYKVFYQVIMNAIKYTPDGGRITVRGRIVDDAPKEPEMEVVVEDTGIGVSAEHHDAIFEKFFQTGEVLFHSSGKTKFKGGGSGLGLAIARGIIQAHKGRIWVESTGYDEEKCPGSRFVIRLPLNGSKA
jgi:signal transduction histidine kinase